MSRWLAAVGLAALAMAQAGVHAQTYVEPPVLPPTPPPPPDSVDVDDLTVRPSAPDYFAEYYRSALLAPLPAKIYRQGGIPRFVLPSERFENPAGKLGNASGSGVVDTTQNAFFQPLGTNGRACVTCHQPPSGMSISLRNIKARFRNTGGTDPLFAPVDGADCPDALPAASTSGSLGSGLRGRGKRALREAHSLLLNKGLIRVFLPVPANAQFTVQVVSDPPGCNTRAPFTADPATGARILSMYRRPIISANLPFKIAVGGSDPRTAPTNIMWDGREGTLASQAIDATFGHAQRSPDQGPLSTAQVQEMVDFETRFFSAQLVDRVARRLDADGAAGGPERLSGRSPAPPPPPPPAPRAFDEYDAWAGLTGTGAKTARQQSIARGQAIFNTRPMTITNVAGFNDFPGVGNPPAFPTSCATCHGFPHAGSELVAPTQRDIGTGGQARAFGGPPPAGDLPVFRFTCTGGSSHPFYGTTVTTNDPGPALISGRCADIGKKTVPQLRALAAHEPYFSDGSARTLLDVVNFYDRRFAMNLAPQEKTDLVNFLNAL